MTATQEPQTLDIPGLLGKLAEFCDLNSEHITADSTVDVSLKYGQTPHLHLRALGNAAKALGFALDILDGVRIEVVQHKNSRHLHVYGSFDGVLFELVSCSDDYDSSVIDSYVDWEQANTFGYVQITPEVLRAMAAHEVAEVSVPQ